MNFFYLLTLFVLTFFLNSCAATKGILVSEIHRGEHISSTIDSVYVVDSIFIYVNGDTVRETRFRDRWRDRIVLDTIWLADTIPKIVTVEVEKQLNFWDRIKLKISPFIIVIFLVWLFIFVIKKRLGAS